MDEADLAQGHRECFERLALARTLAGIPKGEAARECEDCGEPIPEARRSVAPGCVRCIGCQERFERRPR